MRLQAVWRVVWPTGDGHRGCDWPEIGVFVDGTNWARGGGQRASSGGAGTGGEGPGWKCGCHLGGGLRTWGATKMMDESLERISKELFGLKWCKRSVSEQPNLKSKATEARSRD